MAWGTSRSTCHRQTVLMDFFFLMIRRPPRSTHCISSAASDVYKRQVSTQSTWALTEWPCFSWLNVTKFCGVAQRIRAGRAFNSEPRSSFVVCPHPNNFDGLYVVQHLIHKSVLDIHSSGIGTGQIANQFLKGRRTLERVLRQDHEESLGLRFQTRSPQFLGILLGLLGEDKRPTHHFSSLPHLLTGVFIPS
eukprot:TRINITY_DN35369_c0_g1_i1.p1 TRINITY_DN35369_c0_g1~~TRINITY_DN35369_c0_g1_i1.p1  ORF type:complete len:192 (-),score=5.68 TRINITY_DN35369_c0_g1_i1:553-1128(-)